MSTISGRKGFLSLLFVVKDASVKKIIEAIYSLHDRNESNIGDINYCLSAKDGLQEFEFNFPDMVFIQTELSDGSGFELLKDVLASNPKAFVVMISNSGTVELVKKSISLGARGFLIFPFSPSAINEYVARFFKEYFSEDSHGYDDKGEV